VVGTIDEGIDLMLKKTFAPVIAGVLALSLAACSGDDTDPADPTSSESSAPSAQESVDPDKVSPPDLPTVPRVRRERGAIKDVTFGECATKAGEQTVTGELTSSAQGTVDYLVTISWTTGSGDVMGRGFAVVEDVEPGATEPWEITAKVAKGATQCVNGASFGRIG
jgi:hypothetical protein